MCDSAAQQVACNVYGLSWKIITNLPKKGAAGVPPSVAVRFGAARAEICSFSGSWRLSTSGCWTMCSKWAHWRTNLVFNVCMYVCVCVYMLLAAICCTKQITLCSRSPFVTSFEDFTLSSLLLNLFAIFWVKILLL